MKINKKIKKGNYTKNYESFVQRTFIDNKIVDDFK